MVMLPLSHLVDRKADLEYCIDGEVFLPLVPYEAVLLVVSPPLMELDQISHQDVQQPVCPSPCQPLLGLREPAFEAAVVALNCCIGVLVGVRELAEGHHPVHCIFQSPMNPGT